MNCVGYFVAAWSILTGTLVSLLLWRVYLLNRYLKLHNPNRWAELSGAKFENGEWRDARRNGVRGTSYLFDRMDTEDLEIAEKKRMARLLLYLLGIAFISLIPLLVIFESICGSRG